MDKIAEAFKESSSQKKKKGMSKQESLKKSPTSRKERKAAKKASKEAAVPDEKAVKNEMDELTAFMKGVENKSKMVDDAKKEERKALKKKLYG